MANRKRPICGRKNLRSVGKHEVIWTWNGWGYTEVLPFAPKWASALLKESLENFIDLINSGFYVS